MSRRPYILGLTGAIGSGKSTTAGMFAEAGVPVWDADAAVHELYATDAALIAEVAALAPDAVADGKIDRQRLKALIGAEPDLLGRLEAAVHPRVAAHRAAFLARQDAPLVVLDIPLLYEVGAEAICDGVLVVATTAQEQRRRVLARGSMTPATLDMILARQMPMADKVRRADFVIQSTSLDSARRAVHDLIATLTEGADRNA